MNKPEDVAARIAYLEQQINEALGWGAAVAAMNEELQELKRRNMKQPNWSTTLKVMPATKEKTRYVISSQPAVDAAYAERNKVVRALASLFPSGIARTNILGWDPEWHGCVYIDLPTGQVSWHYHDREADLFADLPAYPKPWDGHDTEEKYRRVLALRTEPVCKYCSGTGQVTGWVENLPTGPEQKPDYMDKEVIRLTEIAYRIFEASDKPAPFNRMRDVVHHLMIQLRKPAPDVRARDGIGRDDVMGEIAPDVPAASILDEIAQERRRQVEAEGWSLKHDDAHDLGQLAAVAGCYALNASDHRNYRLALDGKYVPCGWPFSWSARWWKPKDPRRDLVRAAALIVAEIERLDRAAELERERGG